MSGVGHVPHGTHAQNTELKKQKQTFVEAHNEKFIQTVNFKTIFAHLQIKFKKHNKKNKRERL